MAPQSLEWQSKLVLLLVAPWVAIDVLLQAREAGQSAPDVLYWTLGLSGLLGLLAFAAKSGTAAASAMGALITAELMFSTAQTPFHPLRSELVPVLTLLVLTSLATRFGRGRKERMGTAEQRHGRGAAQVAANLGLAALLATPAIRMSLADTRWLAPRGLAAEAMLAVILAALAEAAADTISSELGQVLGGTPVMITTLRRVEPGTDGGITLAGTLAGIVAAGLVSAAGVLAMGASGRVWVIAFVGGVFGLLFDSLLGATLERARWLNNDAVNFLSTASAAAVALALVSR